MNQLRECSWLVHKLVTGIVLVSLCCIHLGCAATEAISKLGTKPCPETQAKQPASNHTEKKDAAWLTDSQKYVPDYATHLRGEPSRPAEEEGGGGTCREAWAWPVLMIGIVPCIVFDIVTAPIQYLNNMQHIQ